jgi:hypothetical protein
MSAGRVAIIAAVGLFALPALSGAASHSAATRIRISDRPAYVRVQVDLPRGTIKPGSVSAGPVTRTEASVELRHANPTSVAAQRAHGLNVALLRNSNGVVIKATFARGRIKYLSYPFVAGNEIVLDLWKSAPPRKPSHTCNGLTLSSNWSSDGHDVSVRGREHGIFENQFQVVVRGQSGAVLGRKTVKGPGRWAAKVHYHVAYRQEGTVEAVAFSAKDGALECLAQHFVELPPN